jgi:hypothetical protein
MNEKKFTLADVYNLKSGDIFYYNYGRNKLHRKGFSQKCIFSHIVDDRVNNKLGLKIAYCVFGTFFEEYYMSKSYLTDCGVVPYTKHGLTGFNKWNTLTKEPLYPVCNEK